MKLGINVRCLGALCAATMLASIAGAAVTNLVWYRLGENDPGAFNGVAVTNTTTDLIGFENLKQVGSPIYTNAVSTGAGSNVGSSLAINFNGTSQYLSNGVVSTLTDNFGIEAWVKPEAASVSQSYVIAFNGAANGWGIYQTGPTYSGLLGGVGTVGSGTATVGTWTHLALVRSGGVATFYVNGFPSGSTSTSAPLTPTTGFAIGNTVLAVPSQSFNGAIDEVRVFTFGIDPSTTEPLFSTNDLLFNLKRVTTAGVVSFGPTNATIAGAVYPPGLSTSAWFEWGTTTNYGNITSTQLFGGQAGSTNFNQAISNLQFATTYHFHAVVSSALGIATGADSSFTTTGPSAQTLAATGIDSATATLNATSSPGSGGGNSGWFQWGTSTNYGNTTTAQALPVAPSGYSQGLNGLAGGTTYQFRAVLSNSLGVATGSNLSFSTLPALTVTTQPASAVGTNSATMNGTANPGGASTFGYFEYGATTNYGSTTSQQALGSGTSGTNFSLVLAPVTGGQTYHYRADATRNAHIVTGNDQTFTVPVFPVVTTLPATGPSNGLTFTLEGTVNPEGVSATAWFEWGPTTNYGNTTAAQPLDPSFGLTNLSQTLNYLTAGTYQFHAVASNAFGVAVGTNQSFTMPVFTLAVTNLPGVWLGSVAWGDDDNDGFLDILLTGQTISSGGGFVFQVWRNTGNGFTNINASLPAGLGIPAIWADYDNDGRLDIITSAGIWQNTGSGFSNSIGGVAGALSGSSIAVGDYDNDGHTDILLEGNGLGGPIAEVWRNTGNGFTNINANLPTNAAYGSVAWGDFDNDGRLDILLSGIASIEPELEDFAITQIWRNTGTGFSNINASLPGVCFSSVAVGDYDNDGRLDILLAGAPTATGAPITQVWRNTGNGFTNINANLPGVSHGSVAWGDFDNDGLLDILITGTTNGQPSGAIAQVWRNTGNGFTNLNLNLPGVMDSSAAWGDYDNDGRLDILLAGMTSSMQVICQIWHNNTPLSNAPPTAPTGLAATIVSNGVNFSWNAASDAQTPVSGLSYNLRIGTTPGGSDVLSPVAGAGGFRRLPQSGPKQSLTTTFNYVQGTPYYWSVQAIDGSFAGSPFAPEGAFKILQAPPVFIPVTATNIVPGDLDGDGIVSQSELAAVLANLNGNGIVNQSELNLVLSNYFPHSPFLLMTNVAGLGGTNVTFSLSNSTAGAFSVEYSTNLVDWQFLGPATPLYEFFDTNAPALPQRFYRLRWP